MLPIRWPHALRPRLATVRFGHAVRAFDAVGSTNAEAAAWAAEGAAEGSLVVAEHQTAGRGRQGRAWHDAPGQNLACSLVLRPALPPARLPLVALAAALAAAEAVDSFLGAGDADRPTVAIKWPNDLLLPAPGPDALGPDAPGPDAARRGDGDGAMRKVGGLLLEASFARAPDAVVLGLGLNVNQTAFPGALAATATSLAAVVGRPVPRPPLLARLLARLERRYDALLAGDDTPLRAAYTARLHHRGQPVTLRPAPDATGAAVTGIVEGITPTGALRLRTDDGAARTFHAGDVTTQGLG